jgi:predicted metal-binding protein
MGLTCERAEVLVCVKCRASAEVAPEDPRPGMLLFDALTRDLVTDDIAVTAVECLSNCSRGCSVALRSHGKWTYVYGNLAPFDSAIVAEGALKYREAPDGLVPWRERPEHFRKNCIARIPPLEQPHEKA